LQFQVIRIGPASGGDQQVGPAHRFRGSPHFHTQGNSAVLPLDVCRRGTQDKTDAFAFQRVLHGFRDIGVLAGENLVLAVDDGHPAAEPAEHLPELQADVPAAEDEQVVRHFGQLHHAGVVQEVDPVEPFQARDVRPGAGVNKDALAF
jgi:hypothetical protein